MKPTLTSLAAAAVALGLLVGAPAAGAATPHSAGEQREHAAQPDQKVGPAGADGEAGVDGIDALRGKVGDGDAADAHWEIVKAPPAGDPEDHQPAAKLISPAGPTAGFDPDAFGTYVLGFTEGGETDLKKIVAGPRNKLLPIETMAGHADEPSRVGIKIGRQDFLLSDAEARGGSGNSTVQVLVLRRRTLQFVSNRRYNSLGALSFDLSALSPEDLVIVVSQPTKGNAPNFPNAERVAFSKALETLGAPEYGANMPLRDGSLSLIGVPGLPKGTANVNVLTDGDPKVPQPEARMNGYLTPDEYGHYGFISSVEIPFSLPAGKPEPPCNLNSGDCESKVGFRMRVRNSRTGAIVKDTFFNTGATLIQEMALIEALEKDVPFEDLVELEARTVYLEGHSFMPLFLTPTDRTHVNRLAAAIGKLGGTRNGFNRALSPEIPGSAMPYALIGWGGAGEGAGDEVAEGAEGVGKAPRLSGILRPDLQSRVRPAAATPATHGPNLAEWVLKTPSEMWPLEDNPPALAAFDWLGGTVKALGPDPRSAYWIQDFTPSRWRELANEVNAVQWEEVPTKVRSTFKRADFNIARKELTSELRWVGNVTEYLEKLEKPFEEDVFKSWREVQTIGDEIFHQSNAPGGAKVAFSVAQVTSMVLKIAGPLTAGISSSIGAAIDLGVWAFGATSGGAPTYADFSIEAHKIGATLSEEMEAAAETFSSMREVIVTDPQKLKKIGEEALCNPANPECEADFAFTAAERRRVGTDLSRSIQRVAWERLLPLKYKVYWLNLYHGTAAPDVHKYGCSLYPWVEYKGVGLLYGTTAWQEELHPDNTESTWRALVLSNSRESLQGYGHLPEEKVLRRVFGPVPTDADNPDAENPKAGGLGVTLGSIARAQGKALWAKWLIHPEEDQCSW